MKNAVSILSAAMMLLLLSFAIARADTMTNIPGTGGGVTQITAGTNVTISPSGGTGNVTVNASGGGGSASPFAPAGFANVTTFNYWADLAISPDGQYVYVDGVLASNSHGAIAKVKIADGTVAATLDLGAATEPAGVAVLPDNAHLYAYDTYSGTGWYVTTATMVVARTDTLTPAVGNVTFQQFDLSPDGSVYAYVSGVAADEKVYTVATATGVETSVTVGHSDGGSAGASSVCWYNGSSANFYVAYNGVASVDLYSAGVYTSTVATGAGGTPNFAAMRSGINNNFYIADSGTHFSLIGVAGGTPTIYPISVGIDTIATNSLSPTATVGATDVCYTLAGNAVYMLDSSPAYGLLIALATPSFFIDSDGTNGLAIAPDTSQRVFTVSGINYPEVWSIASIPGSAAAPGAAGNLQTSDGLGNWVSQAPVTATNSQAVPSADVPYGSNWTPICTLALTAGTYLIVGQACVYSGNANQDSYLRLNDGTANFAATEFYNSAVPGQTTMVSISSLYTATGTVTITLSAYANGFSGTVSKNAPSSPTLPVTNLAAVRLN